MKTTNKTLRAAHAKLTTLRAELADPCTPADLRPELVAAREELIAKHPAVLDL